MKVQVEHLRDQVRGEERGDVYHVLVQSSEGLAEGFIFVTAAEREAQDDPERVLLESIAGLGVNLGRELQGRANKL